MVKSLKFLRHRRTEAGYFSEFLIAKTPVEDLENRAPLQQQQQSPKAVILSAPSAVPPTTSSAAAAAVPAQQAPAASYSLFSLQPDIVARQEVVVTVAGTSTNTCQPISLPVQAFSSQQQQLDLIRDSQRDSTARDAQRDAQRDPTRVIRRRERNRAAAAKCRQRRQDRLDSLADCVRDLEEANAALEAEVAQLATARAQLEVTVRYHQAANCESSDAAAAEAAAAAAAADVFASPTEDSVSTSSGVWLTPPPPTPPPMASRRPTSLSLSGSGFGDDQELPSLTTPRCTVGSGSGLTPLLMTPMSAFKMELSM